MSLRLCGDVTACDTDDGLVLLDGRRGRYWQLNTTGAAILRALLGGARPEQVAEQLARKQPVAPEQAAADIEDLIARLTGARLIEHQGAP
ncbi:MULTISPECIES: lasso peptide biosynthesis PqqD family chaperone [unclassified Streptomyces]|uniref:lasso peptide biosynthesis PqqD family chaperone n=1 Tax=unclassified Streptomyces TaxID=2593676 RepID=UPI0033A54A77